MNIRRFLTTILPFFDIKTKPPFGSFRHITKHIAMKKVNAQIKNATTNFKQSFIDTHFNVTEEDIVLMNFLRAVYYI
jgi:hypothetical protein